MLFFYTHLTYWNGYIGIKITIWNTEFISDPGHALSHTCQFKLRLTFLVEDTNISHHTNRKWVLWGSKSSMEKESVHQRPSDSLEMTNWQARTNATQKGRWGIRKSRNNNPAYKETNTPNWWYWSSDRTAEGTSFYRTASDWAELCRLGTTGGSLLPSLCTTDDKKKLKPFK